MQPLLINEKPSQVIEEPVRKILERRKNVKESRLWQIRYLDLKSKGKKSGKYDGEVVTIDECRRRWKDTWVDLKNETRERNTYEARSKVGLG